MRPVTVLHCSDLHLGRSLPQGRSEELLMTFEDLILLAEQRKADLFLIAGDLFDQPVPEKDLVEFVRSRLEKLPENMTVAIAPGNHDYLCSGSPYLDCDWGRRVKILTGEAVELMTIHKSKGLEYPICFVAQLEHRFNQQDLQQTVLLHGELGMAMPVIRPQRGQRYDNLPLVGVRQAIRRENLSEELRVLYVAMTRAREKLILIDCRKGMEKKLRDLTAMTGIPVPPEAVADADSPGELSLIHI